MLNLPASSSLYACGIVISCLEVEGGSDVPREEGRFPVLVRLLRLDDEFDRKKSGRDGRHELILKPALMLNHSSCSRLPSNKQQQGSQEIRMFVVQSMFSIRVLSTWNLQFKLKPPRYFTPAFMKRHFLQTSICFRIVGGGRDSCLKLSLR